MSDNMVERVARALYARELERARHCEAVLSQARGAPIKDTMEPFEDCKEAWLGDARAAIEAMREPTPEMIDAGLAVTPWEECRTGGSRKSDTTARLIWPAMITAALAPAGRE